MFTFKDLISRKRYFCTGHIGGVFYYRKSFLIFACIIVVLPLSIACSSSEAIAQKSTGIGKSSKDTALNRYMLEELKEAIIQTPYSAVIQHTSVETHPIQGAGAEDDAIDVKQVYHAKVLKTFRGELHATIDYILLTEKGDTPSVNTDPVIITLCKNAQGYYWPGVGSIFPYNDETKAIVDKVLLSLPKSQHSYTNCN